MKYDFESTLDRPGHDAIRLNLALPDFRNRRCLLVFSRQNSIIDLCLILFNIFVRQKKRIDRFQRFGG